MELWNSLAKNLVLTSPFSHVHHSSKIIKSDTHEKFLVRIYHFPMNFIIPKKIYSVIITLSVAFDKINRLLPQATTLNKHFILSTRSIMYSVVPQEIMCKKIISNTLRKFWWYNRASLGDLVLLAILGKHQQGLTLGIQPRYMLVYIFAYLHDISLSLTKDCTKCQGSKVYLVESSEFYENETKGLASIWERTLIEWLHLPKVISQV